MSDERLVPLTAFVVAALVGGLLAVVFPLLVAIAIGWSSGILAGMWVGSR